MRIKLGLGCILAGLASVAHAQDAIPSAVPPAAPPVTPPPAKVVLENLGKPIVTPFRCTDADLHWAGMSCAEDEPCPVFLELSGVAPVGGRILATGNIHTDSVTLYSVLLSSDDAGKTWSEPTERLRGSALDHIQFSDASNGWIAGEELFPIPQNPFLLRTSDGGQTWAQAPVFNEGDEGRFGSVQQFAFVNSRQGSLIVDRGRASSARYGLYETRDGGETWSLRQESARLPVLNAPAAAAEWRVRVDARARAFSLERHEGQRWLPVASFAVRLEPCKPSAAAEPGDQK